MSDPTLQQLMDTQAAARRALTDAETALSAAQSAVSAARIAWLAAQSATQAKVAEMTGDT